MKWILISRSTEIYIQKQKKKFSTFKTGQLNILLKLSAIFFSFVDSLCVCPWHLCCFWLFGLSVCPSCILSYLTLFQWSQSLPSFFLSLFWQSCLLVGIIYSISFFLSLSFSFFVSLLMNKLNFLLQVTICDADKPSCTNHWLPNYGRSHL